jgi:hypothetical protein
MVERGVNHPIRRGRATPQAVQIIKIAPMRLGASGGQRLCALIRASETKHLMARVDEFLHNCGPDKSRSAGDEDTHRNFSSTSFDDRFGGGVVTEIGD